jgi:hypothetical protein
MNEQDPTPVVMFSHPSPVKQVTDATLQARWSLGAIRFFLEGHPQPTAPVVAAVK